jgi:uncharacterized membrane protein YebE (DUF533 family)
MRQAPKQKIAKENIAPEAKDSKETVEIRGQSAGSSGGMANTEFSKSKSKDGARSGPPSEGNRSGAISPQDLEEDADMAELKALMAANDLEAAEAKLQLIIEAAEEDGHVDEDEQRQIDEAKSEVTAMRRRQEEQKMAFEAAAAKAAEQAALQALLVSNDVVAAQRKLAEIVAAAEEDGHIDEEEKRQIDEARKELEKLQVKFTPRTPRPCSTHPDSTPLARPPGVPAGQP